MSDPSREEQYSIELWAYAFQQTVSSSDFPSTEIHGGCTNVRQALEASFAVWSVQGEVTSDGEAEKLETEPLPVVEHGNGSVD